MELAEQLFIGAILLCGMTGILAIAGILVCAWEWMQDSFKRKRMATYIQDRWDREAQAYQEAEQQLLEEYEETTRRG